MVLVKSRERVVIKPSNMYIVYHILNCITLTKTPENVPKMFFKWYGYLDNLSHQGNLFRKVISALKM